jgi:tetratricopeptide (TPR) repeat protein
MFLSRYFQRVAISQCVPRFFYSVPKQFVTISLSSKNTFAIHERKAKQWVRCFALTRTGFQNSQPPKNIEFNLPELEEAKKLLKQGKYQQSEMLFERSLEICESVMGPTHPASMDIKKQMKEVYVHLKRGAKLQKVLEQLYRNQQHDFEKQYHELFNLARNLIVWCQFTKNFQPAIDILTHFVSEQNKLPRSESLVRDQIQALTWLGSCYGAKFQFDGEKEGAKAHFDRALQLSQSLQSNTLSLVLAKGNLARYFHEKADFERAEAQYRELIDIIEKFTPTDSNLTETKDILQGELYVDLGELLRVKRDLEQSDQWLKKGIDLIDKYYSRDSDTVRYILQWIFLELVDQKQFFYAEGLYRRLMDLWEKCVRPDQYQIESMMKYQEVLKKFEREKEAFELAQKTNMVMAKQPQNINLFTLHLSFLNK